MTSNTALLLGSIVAFFIFIYIMYHRAKSQTQQIEDVEYSTFEELIDAVKQEMIEITKDIQTVGLTEAQYTAQYKRIARIENALRECVYGIDSAKIIVTELIRDFISKNVKPDRISALLGMSDGMIPTNHVMFEALMYKYKRMDNGKGGFIGRKALDALIKKYEIDRDRYTPDGRHDNYYFEVNELIDIYEKENLYFSEAEKCDLLAILVYQQYKGFGILDTLREMDINGFNIGTSGSIMKNLADREDNKMQATDSCWVYYDGKYIHFRFMSFGHEDEVKRIVQLIARYNNPGSLTSKRGYLVNTMYDKSRVLAIRPPAGEYWAVFVRKFTISNPSPETLLIKEWTKNGHIVIQLIDFLVNGLMTIGVTGRQGSGKTTLMSSIIRFIDNRFTIRILEMAPELYLREIYPNRNILSVQETQHITAEELQDALKKSDAAYSIVGEVATDSVAARMVQMGMTASLATIFSHHATTADNLVYTLRNSLMNALGISAETAERQILHILNFNIHLDYDATGKRYVERITEIIPLKENRPLPVPQGETEFELRKSYYMMMHEVYTRQFNNQTFITKDILVYDLKTHTYHPAERITHELEDKLRKNLKERAIEYDKFMLKYWGKRPNNEPDVCVVSVLSEYKDSLPLNVTTDEESTLSPVDEMFEILQSDTSVDMDELIGVAMGFVETEEQEKLREFQEKVESVELTEQELEEAEDLAVTLDFYSGGISL